MSDRFSRVPVQVLRAKVSPSAVLLLVAIGSYADKTGLAFPSMSKLAGKTGFARKNIPRLLDVLEAADLLRRERQKDEYGRPAITAYRLIYRDVGVLKSMRTSKSNLVSSKDAGAVSSKNADWCPQDEPFGVLKTPRATLEQPIRTAHTEQPTQDARVREGEEWAEKEADRLAEKEARGHRRQAARLPNDRRATRKPGAGRGW